MHESSSNEKARKERRGGTTRLSFAFTLDRDLASRNKKNENQQRHSLFNLPFTFLLLPCSLRLALDSSLQADFVSLSTPLLLVSDLFLLPGRQAFLTPAGPAMFCFIHKSKGSPFLCIYFFKIRMLNSFPKQWPLHRPSRPSPQAASFAARGGPGPARAATSTRSPRWPGRSTSRRRGCRRVYTVRMCMHVYPEGTTVDRSTPYNVRHAAVHVVLGAVARAHMAGALRVDEAEEDGGAQGSPGFAEGGGDAVAGGARFGGVDLGGDLSLLFGWEGVVRWEVGMVWCCRLF